MNILSKIKKLYQESRVTFSLLLIMLIYFIALTLLGGSTNTYVLVKYGAFYPPLIILYHEYYRFITSIFIHIGLSHIFFNSYALYMFGPLMERLMGAKKYLAFFLLTGIGGNILTFLFNFDSVSAGASGSLFGILGAFLYLVHRHKGLIAEDARKSILKLIIINLIITVIVPSISLTAHLGGLVVGYLLSYIFIK